MATNTIAMICEGKRNNAFFWKNGAGGSELVTVHGRKYTLTN